MFVDVAELKQEKFAADVIISGLPKTIDESPHTLRRLVVDVFKSTDAAAAVESVLDVYRAPNIIKNMKQQSDAAADIVVKLNNKEAKVLLINNRLQLSSAFAKAFQKPETFHVFIKDHLSNHYKMLFNMARLLKHKAGYKFVWTKHCKIYIQKDDTRDSPKTLIRSFQQLKVILQKNNVPVTDIIREK